MMADKKAMISRQQLLRVLLYVDIVREGGSKLGLLHAGEEKGIGPGAKE